MGKEAREEDERREAALASIESLQPNSKPTKSGVTQAQLAKFQELHRRRLQIKTKFKDKKKSRGAAKVKGLAIDSKELKKDYTDESSNKSSKNSSISCSDNNMEIDSSPQNGETVDAGSKKRQKLHWGLDTKERWERKSNM